MVRSLPQRSPSGPKHSWQAPYAIANTKITRAACPTVTENSSDSAGNSVSQARMEAKLAKQQAPSSHSMERCVG